MRSELSYLTMRSSPERRRRQLLETRLAELTVADLLDVLDELDQMGWVRERGLDAR